MAYSPAENLYLSALTELQFPSTVAQDEAEVMTDQAELAAEPVMLAQAPTRTMTDAGPQGPQITGEIKPIDPTMRQRLGDFLQAGFERVGMDRYRARKQAETLMGGDNSNLPLGLGLADLVPILGTAMQLQESGRMAEDAAASAKQGDMGMAALQAGGAALGIVPGAASTAATTVKAAKAAKAIKKGTK